jgi:hypothetical protein
MEFNQALAAISCSLLAAWMLRVTASDSVLARCVIVYHHANAGRNNSCSFAERGGKALHALRVINQLFPPNRRAKKNAQSVGHSLSSEEG